MLIISHSIFILQTRNPYFLSGVWQECKCWISEIKLFSIWTPFNMKREQIFATSLRIKRILRPWRYGDVLEDTITTLPKTDTWLLSYKPIGIQNRASSIFLPTRLDYLFLGHVWPNIFILITLTFFRHYQ